MPKWFRFMFFFDISVWLKIMNCGTKGRWWCKSVTVQLYCSHLLHLQWRQKHWLCYRWYFSRFKQYTKPRSYSCPAAVLGTRLSLEQGPMQIAQLVVLLLLEMETLWCACCQGNSQLTFYNNTSLLNWKCLSCVLLPWVIGCCVEENYILKAIK